MKQVNKIVKEYFKNPQSEEVKGAFAYWLLANEQLDEKEDAMHEVWSSIDAQPDATTLYELSLLHEKIASANQKKKTSLFKRLSKIAAVILIPLLFTFVGYYFTQAFYVEHSDMIECYAEYGEQKQVTMPDGTHVWLNSGSLLVYPERFNGKTRNVYLSGEANFEVAKNPKKKLIVKTNHMEVEALGTVFNLQAYNDLSKITATLEEGKIRVGTLSQENSQTFILSPNEQIIYDKKTNEVVRKEVDAQRVSLWKEQYMIFQEASFVEILHALEKRFAVTFYYDSMQYEGGSYTLRFRPDDTLEDALEILKEINSLFKYRIKDKAIYVQ